VDVGSRKPSREEKPVDANVIVIGLVALIAIATMIGITMERTARATAWRRIAEERRWNWEQRSGPEN